MRSRSRGVAERQQILDICGFEEGQTEQPRPRRTGKEGQQLRPSVPHQEKKKKRKKANHLQTSTKRTRDHTRAPNLSCIKGEIQSTRV